MDETGKDNVGFSLLTNENPLTVDNDDQEDAEAEEDQRRRQQELQSMLANAFDDFGEENSTINSSFDGSSSNVLTSGHAGCEETSRHTSETQIEEQYRNAQYNSSEQLQVLYQVQAREIKRLHNDLSILVEEKDKEINGLKRRMLLLEGDLNGTTITLKQCQELLVEKRRDIDEHLREINQLKDTIDNLTLAKRDSDEETQIWKTKYMELEQKMNLIDQGLYVPVSERQIRNKYEQDISELQNGLEQSHKNLEKALKAKIIAENELKEIKKSHELLAMGKEEEIHNLYSQLENSKFQCHNLTDRIGSIEKEYQNLTNMLNQTTKDPETTVQYSGPVKILQQELKRSLDDQKMRRDEIIKLEKKLEEQHKIELELLEKIKNLEEKNKTILNDNQSIHKDKELMMEKINMLTKSIDELESQLKDKIEKIEVDYQKIETEKENLLKQLDIIKSEKINVENQSKQKIVELQNQIDSRRSSTHGSVKQENEMLKMQNDQLYKQLEETNKLKKDIELQGLKKIQEMQSEMKPNTSDKKLQIIEEQYNILKCNNEQLQSHFRDVQGKSDQYKQQLDKYEKLCLELEETCAEQKNKQYEYHTKISELEGKLSLKEKRDDLLDDLQQKALMFEQYIKNKSDVLVHDKSVNTDTNDFEKLLNQQHEKLIEISNENKTLKEKVVFDRMALNELTDVWNAEINRLNNLVKNLKKEIESKNEIIEKRQQNVNEEIAQMGMLINKLSETLRSKDQFIKEFQDKEVNLKKKQEEITHKIKSDYQQKETRILTQFEENMEEMKLKFQHEEKHMKMKFENIQQKCVGGLDEINQQITTRMKYDSEKYALENKIIEAYYDLLIQQAKHRKK